MIPGLDGLRAIALLLVLGTHTGNLEFGWIGVQLFFVLSGFLITGILLRMKETQTPKMYFTKFYGRRFLRIFPLYYFYLFLLFGIEFITPYLDLKPLINEFGDKFWVQVWPSIFYVYNFFHASTGYEQSRFFTHLWSLSVEEQFYIIWPLILFFTPKDKLKKLFISAIIFAPIIRGILYIIFVKHPFPFMIDIPEVANYVLPFAHIDAFAFGAYISQFKILRPRLKFIAAIIIVPVIGYLSQYLATGQITLNTLGQEFLLSSSYKSIWGYSLLNYLFAVTIYSVVHPPWRAVPGKTDLFTLFLDSAPLRYLGKISYGLYVYHAAVIWVILKFSTLFESGTPGIYLFALAISTIIATLSFYLFEKPISDLKDKFFPLSQHN